ncbi:DUF1361 domain-containing protein [Chitinophagaceae bacterium LB-8]|uniref:DUF1361 domain-containing protein n=1 Tax=Paraflavisolibacter caeni TaxID=2982496 RepID=A0A9X2XUF1_9BACT|nr:DUF1361 domain-containing protein [Paraflavisolibacter caeni]MCU7548567.1 DUF1361 domain-containing protein [Paraflavisolibacter caeni]
MNYLISKVPFLRRFYFEQSELNRTLLLSCLFSIVLVCIRGVYADNWRYISLIWNLFLAFVPYWISNAVSKRDVWKQSNIKFFAFLTCWLLFLPNSFYIITDLFHLRQNVSIPLWFDLALIFSFAWNGLLMGVISVRQIEKVIEKKWDIETGIWFLYPIMLLNALGIYLGRYLRFNSWDVVTNPSNLIDEIRYLLVHPIRNRFDWGMIFCYAVLMTLIYVTVKRISKAI